MRFCFLVFNFRLAVVKHALYTLGLSMQGYGHYLLHEQLLGDPLEEIMGEMMETDMAAAIELLNSKGISIIPMALANDLIQSG